MQISVCVLWMYLCKFCFSLLIFLCGNRQEQLRKRHWKKRCQIKSKGNCILLRHIESHLKTLTFLKEHSQVVQFNMLCTFGARSTQLRISCSIVILSIFVLVFLLLLSLLLALSVNSVIQIEPNWFRLAIFDLWAYQMSMSFICSFFRLLSHNFAMSLWLFCVYKCKLDARDYITSIVHCLCHGHMRTNAIYTAHALYKCTMCV